MNEQPAPEEDDIKKALGEMLYEARSGDHASAVMTAMLIHRYPQESRDMGISILYESLLLQALQSNDAELLACLAEELLVGVKLAGDGRMAHRAVSKADDISGFMGAYILGRMMAAIDPHLALEQLRKGCKVGHIASLSWAHRLLAKKIPLIGQFLWFFLAIGLFFRAVGAVLSKDRRRLWRALDVMNRKEYFDDLVGGPDRKKPFSAIEGFVPEVETNNPRKEK